MHSQIPREKQEGVFEQPADGVCHVVLASNIAESSLTLPNVTAVFHRHCHRDPHRYRRIHRHRHRYGHGYRHRHRDLHCRSNTSTLFQQRQERHTESSA